jgi:DNA-binding NtrC family response regulator
VEEGTFRGDLFHRLNVVRVHVPPLRERPEDISALLDHYNDFYAKQYNQAARGFPAELRKALLSYPWPGNVRELCAYLERLYATNTAPKPPGDNGWEDGYRPADPAAKASGKRACSLAEAEAQAICDALRCTGNNRSAAAKILNIHRSTLIRKIRELGLEDDED